MCYSQTQLGLKPAALVTVCVIVGELYRISDLSFHDCLNPLRWLQQKYHRLGGLNIYFSQFWRVGSPSLRCWQIWCLVKAHFLVQRLSSSRCALTWRKGEGRSLS